MKKFRRMITVLLTLITAFTLVPVAFAHPLGNFTINHYAGIHVSKDSVNIDYVLDMAEIPAFQEIAAFDANGNSLADPAETAAYHAAKCASLQPDLRLILNEKALGLTLASSAVEFPAGFFFERIDDDALGKDLLRRRFVRHGFEHLFDEFAHAVAGFFICHKSLTVFEL